MAGRNLERKRNVMRDVPSGGFKSKIEMTAELRSNGESLRVTNGRCFMCNQVRRKLEREAVLMIFFSNNMFRCAFSQLPHVGDVSQRTGELDEFHTLLPAEPVLFRASKTHATPGARCEEETRWERTDRLFSPTAKGQGEM